MPIPKPRPKEDQQTFVSRCISELHKIDPNRPQKQIIAICYDTFRRSKRKRTTQETKAILEWYERQESNRPIEISEALSSEDFKDMTLEDMVNKLKEWKKEIKELGYVSPPTTEKESKHIKLFSNIGSLERAIGERMANIVEDDLMKWYESKIGVPKKDGSGKGVQANKGRGECPKWVQMARRLLASKKGNPKLRSYWQKRLEKYEASIK